MNKKYFNLLNIIIFAFAISLPLLFTSFAGGKLSESENRYLAKFPEISNLSGIKNQNFRSEFELWLNDNIGFREYASVCKKIVLLKAFNEFPEKEKGVIKGSDDWLYLMPDSEIQKYQNRNPLSSKDLSNLELKFIKISEYFKSKNIGFTVMMWPIKANMYPEYMDLNIIKHGKKWNLLNLNDYFSKNEKFDFYVPYKELLESKKKHQIYYKSADRSHWNNYGAFIGYKALMTRAKIHLPNLKILNESDFNIKEVDKETYILNKFFATEKDYEFTLKKANTAVSDKTFFDKINYQTKDIYKSYNYYKNQNKDLPKAIIVGDSFIWMFMLPNISESFSEVVFIHYSDMDNLEMLTDLINPNIVMFAALEGNEWSLADYKVNDNSIDKLKVKYLKDKFTFALDYVNQKLVNSINIEIDNENEFTHLEGWAADIEKGTVAKSVYIQVGSKFIKANYGIEKQSVVDYFKNENLLKTGFTADIKTEDIIKAGGFTICVISNDGLYKYNSNKWIVKQIL